jgi:hypothetical protein
MSEQEQLNVLKEIVGQFDTDHKRVTEAAKNSPKGGDAGWYQIVEEFEVEPATQEIKNHYYSSGIPVGKGALPLELKKVYEKLRFRAIQSYRETLQGVELEGDADEYWDEFNDRLRDFVKDDIDKYISGVKQKVGVNDIFANAFSGMNQFSQNMQESGTTTKKCSNCGAPRLDTDQYDDCYFCGSALFATEKVETSCKVCGAPKYMEDQGKPCKFCNN